MSKDLEAVLREASNRHLTGEMLLSYRELKLDKIDQALASAHLERCLICQERLKDFEEELTVIQAIENADGVGAQDKVRPVPRPSLIESLTACFNEMVAGWRTVFMQAVMRGAEDGDEVWRYESKNGSLTGRAVLEKDASLTIHFSSPELAWEGAKIRFRLGPFIKEVTLQRVRDSEVAAKIEIPRRQRARNLADMSIEVI